MPKHGLVCGCALLCLSGTWAPRLGPSMFFSNSTRRDANDVERSQVVKAAKGCAAFFVANSAGKVFLMSARHCFDYEATEWCVKKKGAFTDNDGKSHPCLRVVAGDRTHDVVLFEAEFDREPDHPLALAAEEPKPGTRLQMIGYPVDRERQGKLTVTEDCWVLKSGVPSRHGGTMNDRSALHNCSTYGGNSGGPMIALGSQTAIGLPFTYKPGDYVPRKPRELKTAASLAEIADFTDTFRTVLEKEGVVIID